MGNFLRIAIILLSFLVESKAFSFDKDLIVLDPSLSQKIQILNIDWLEIDRGIAPIDLPDPKFQALSSENTKIDRPDGYIWFRLHINSISSDSDLTIRHPAALAKELKTFKRSGEKFKNIGYSIADNVANTTFRPSEGTHIYYLRLDTDVRRLNLEIWDPHNLHIERRIDSLIYGGFILITLLTIIFSTLLIYWYPSRLFFAYILASTCTLTFFLFQSGLIRLALPVEFFLAYNARGFAASMALMMFSLGYYLYYFLDINLSKNTYVKSSVKIINTFNLVLAVLFAFDILEFQLAVAHLIVLIGVLYATSFAPSIKSLDAKVMATSWIVFFLHAFVFILHVRGKIPGSWYVVRSVYIGLILQNVIYNFAILIRLDSIRRKNQEARLQLQRSEQVAKEEHDSRLTIQSLLHILCHDLTGPLSVISGNLQISQAIASEKVRDRLAIAMRSCDDLSSMIQVIRTQEAIRTGRHDTTLSKVSVKEAAEYACQMFQERAQQKDVTFKLDLKDELKINADRTIFVFSILGNLLSNALKFSIRGSTIGLKAYHESLSVAIEVSDKGEGIPEELLERLFDETQPASRLGSEGEEGTGFGIMQVQRYTESFGGTVEVESSTGENSGTTFTLRFPKTSISEKSAS